MSTFWIIPSFDEFEGGMLSLDLCFECSPINDLSLICRKEAQDILLQKLTERLSAAAMYLAQMKTAPKSSGRNPKRKPTAAVKRQKAKPDAS